MFFAFTRNGTESATGCRPDRPGDIAAAVPADHYSIQGVSSFLDIRNDDQRMSGFEQGGFDHQVVCHAIMRARLATMNRSKVRAIPANIVGASENSASTMLFSEDSLVRRHAHQSRLWHRWHAVCPPEMKLGKLHPSMATDIVLVSITAHDAMVSSRLIMDIDHGPKHKTGRMTLLLDHWATGCLERERKRTARLLRKLPKQKP